jgi:hypothetical protein
VIAGASIPITSSQPYKESIMTSNIIYHYVYRITNLVENKHYYGKRSSKIKPILDLGHKYFSSSRDKNFIQDQKANPTHYKYKIVANFETSESALTFEIKLHNKFNVGINPPVCDSEGNKFQVSNKDPRYLSGELKSIHKGKVLVKDELGKKFKISIDDPRYISGEVKSLSRGRLVVCDSEGNRFQVSNKDPRYISGELKSINKGKVLVKDANGFVFQISTDDPRYISGELKHNATGTVPVKLPNGKIIRIEKNDPRYISGELKTNFGQESRKGKILVVDTSGKKLYVNKNDPKITSGEYIRRKIPRKNNLDLFT